MEGGGMRYTKRPERARESGVMAAIYHHGESLDDVLAIAHGVDPDAAAVEIDVWRVLLVRHLVIPDHRPSYRDYDVVHDGEYLVCSEDYDVLFTMKAEEFEREYQSRDHVQ